MFSGHVTLSTVALLCVWRVWVSRTWFSSENFRSRMKNNFSRSSNYGVVDDGELRDEFDSGGGNSGGVNHIFTTRDETLMSFALALFALKVLHGAALSVLNKSHLSVDVVLAIAVTVLVWLALEPMWAERDCFFSDRVC